jgi:hypothetical protein
LIAAYEAAPRIIRLGFDDEVAELGALIQAGLNGLEHALSDGPSAGIFAAAEALSSDIRSHVALLAGMINAGQGHTEANEDVDLSADETSGMNQADIDALFD